MPSHFVKLYADILRSSVWAESPATRLLWITMLADADEQGFVRGDVRALARLSNLSVNDTLDAIAVLTAPDEASQSQEEQGRRVVVVKTGLWRVVNYLAYRELRTTKQVAAAERARLYRQRQRDGDVTHVTPRDASHASHEVSTSTSPSVALALTEPIPKQEPVRREGVADPLDEVLTEAKLDVSVFGEAADEVRGFLRTQRAPLSVALLLASHMTDAHGPPASPETVALAVREYGAMGEERFSARHFAGFVKRAGQVLATKTSRVMNHNEQRYVDAEEVRREQERRDDAEADALVADFERTREAQFEKFKAEAEASVDKRVPKMMRAAAVRAKLLGLIRAYGSTGDDDATR